MAQEQQEVRSVNWNEVFAFTHLFKCFRMAIQPSKLLLAAAALIVMFLVGLGMDAIWSASGSYVLVSPGDGPGGEIARCTTESPAEFNRWRQERLEKRRDEAAALKSNVQSARKSLVNFSAFWRTRIGETGKPGEKSLLLDAFNARSSDPNYVTQTPGAVLVEANQKEWDWSRLKGQARAVFREEVSRIESVLSAAEDAAREEIKKISNDSEKNQARQALQRHLDAAARALTDTKVDFDRKVLNLTGMPISEALVAYEWNCIRAAIRAAARGNFLGGLGQVRQQIEGRPEVAPAATDTGALQAPNVTAGAVQEAPPGALLYVLHGYRGFVWLIRTHWVYALVYLLIGLGVVALFGGAVNRMAALHFAREEKISAVQALKFSAGKFLSFFTAPLIPVAIIFVIGVLLMLGGLLLNVMILDWLAGILFFLAILAGLGIAFLATGLVGGAGLMYPTIAAEGSDSFDAISRSYSYVYARPWRAILYGAVACVYGAITYLFVRLFAFVALCGTHWFVKAAVFRGGQALSPAADRLDVIWAAPTFDNLFGTFNWAAMGFWESISAFMIGVWVFVLACVVAGYLLSYAASSTTVIYFLLRRKVDATDLDDVYVEEAPAAPEAAPAAPEAAPAAPEPEAPGAPAQEPPSPPAGGAAPTT